MTPSSSVKKPTIMRVLQEDHVLFMQYFTNIHVEFSSMLCICHAQSIKQFALKRQYKARMVEPLDAFGVLRDVEFYVIIVLSSIYNKNCTNVDQELDMLMRRVNALDVCL